MEDLLRAVGIQETGLLVLPAANDVVARSAGNLPWAKVILAHNLNLYDLFTHDQLVIAKDALDQIEETFSTFPPQRTKGRRGEGPGEGDLNPSSENKRRRGGGSGEGDLT
jgi:Ribosomal protein L4/L1 family